ncbi:uncharacterized protein LOC62_04G005298 [Vanrija pseudolonga]|uniref:Uncharacterized protein n=1 Tax=Vanrija pseudolonga TaxID=143232 RepID=A0AAF1BIN8_9TREE|nr:hypothetical protein LOC62_04G005298 [Vanrija pseudolonga]
MLDHTAYPSIIAAILSYADIPTRLAFSCTSRAYRTQITAELLHHVALRADDGRLSFRAADSTQLPYLPALVHVLDLDGDSYAPAVPPAPGITTLPRPLRDALTSLRLVRRRGTATQDVNDPYKFEFVPTVVDFLDLDYGVQITAVGDYDLGLSTQRHVLHLRWDDDMPIDADDGRLIHDTEFLFHQKAEFDYVLVVQGYASAGRARLASALEVLRIVLSGLAESALEPDASMRITIVGLETTDMVLPHPVAVPEGLDVPEPLRQAAAFLENAVGSIHDYEYEEPSSALFRRMVRFATLEEWRGGLEEEERAVVGQWDEL